MTSIADLTQLIEDEKLFSQNDYFGACNGESEVLFINRQSPLLITAPHAIKHSRNGAVKSADESTGSLALLLAKKLDASILVGHYYNPDLEHITQLSKDFVSALHDGVAKSSILIDIHGMKDSHDSGLCLGTGTQNVETKPLSYFIDTCVLDMAAWNPSLNHPFNAQAPYTLVNYAETSLGLPALQLEIPRRFRVPGTASIGEHLNYLSSLSHSIQKASDQAFS